MNTADDALDALPKLTEELRAAETDYRSASNRASAARSDETMALNCLNAAQRALDAALAVMKGAAPSGSDWRRKDERGTVATK